MSQIAREEQRAMKCKFCHMFIVVHNQDFIDDYECEKCKENSQLHEKILILTEIAHAERMMDVTFNSVCLQSEEAPPTPRNSTGRWVTQRRKTKALPLSTSTEIVHSNRYEVLSDFEEELSTLSEDACPSGQISQNNSAMKKAKKGNLIIGDLMLRDVTVSRTKATISCLSGARATDIEANLKFQKNVHNYNKIIIHIGTNDVRLKQSEITKRSIISMCNVAKQVSDAVICSGPIPIRRGNEIFSRLLSLNNWMSKWCALNNIGYIDNWTGFLEKPELLHRDGLHPSYLGAALIAKNLERSLGLNTS